MARILEANAESIQTAVDCVRAGGVVILPTSTNYNILCDPFNERAVKKLFEAKQRTKFGPLTLYLSSIEDISTYTLPTAGFEIKIAEALWPGEVSFILYKQARISNAVTCNSSTVAVTVHANPVLNQVIERFGKPLSGSSANLSGQGDIFVTAEKAIADLGDAVDLVLNAGATTAAAHPSAHKSNSIVDFSFQPPFLVRKGLISTAALEKIIPDLVADPAAYKLRLKERLAQNNQLQSL